MKTLYLDHNIQVPYEQILYFEHHNKYSHNLNRVTILHTFQQVIILKNTIKEIYVLLDKDIFMMPHQSFIVNMEYIKIFTQFQITLDDNTIIPVSVKRSSAVRLQFLAYIKKRP